MGVCCIPDTTRETFVFLALRVEYCFRSVSGARTITTTGTGAYPVATTTLPMYESGIEREHLRVIFASSLAKVCAFGFPLLAFAAGFVVRPIGALLLGAPGATWSGAST